MNVYREELNTAMPIKAWWTDNDEDTDFTIVGETDGCPSFNLSYLEAKYLYRVLSEKLHRKDF